MASCVTCGSELHPERAEKYDYCTKRSCRERAAKALTIASVGVNKAADQYEVADGRTRAETAGRAESPGRRVSLKASKRPTGAVRPRPGRRAGDTGSPGPSWTASQQHLAGIYSDRGMRPDEIAEKLGLSRRTVIQMLLSLSPSPRPPR